MEYRNVDNLRAAASRLDAGRAACIDATSDKSSFCRFERRRRWIDSELIDASRGRESPGLGYIGP